VWLTIELLAALYAVSFVCFWCLCRVSASRDLNPPRKQETASNLIPFERGLQPSLRKTARFF
jgi:hypothetical protein